MLVRCAIINDRSVIRRLRPNDIRRGVVTGNGPLSHSALWSGSGLLRPRAGGGMAAECPDLVFFPRRYGEQPVRRQRARPVRGWALRFGLRLLLSIASSAPVCGFIVPAAIRTLPRRDAAHRRPG